MSRLVQAVFVICVAVVGTAACSSGDSEPDARSTAAAEPTRSPQEELAAAVAAVASDQTGLFTVDSAVPVDEFGATGSWDLGSGNHSTEFMLSDGEYIDPVRAFYRRRLVDGKAFYQLDRFDDKACWVASPDAQRYAGKEPDVIALLKSLQAVSQDGADVEATVAAGLLGDTVLRVDNDVPSSKDQTSREVRIPVSVKIGKGYVQSVSAELPAVRAALKAAGASEERAFGSLGAPEYLDELGFVTIDLNAFGLPVTIEEPEAAELCDL